MRVASDGHTVVTGSHEGSVCVWMLDNEDVATAILDTAHAHRPLDPSTRTRHRHAPTQPPPSTSIESNALRLCHTLFGHTSPIRSVAVSHQLDLVVSGSQEGRVAVHTAMGGQFIRSFTLDASSIPQEACAGEDELEVDREYAARVGISPIKPGMHQHSLRSRESTSVDFIAIDDLNGNLIIHSWSSLDLYMCTLNGKQKVRLV